MFQINEFEKKLKEDNSHYERFMQSSLHNLVELIRRQIPKATAKQVAVEMLKIPTEKWKKYKNTKNYLLSHFPGLATAIGQISSPLTGSIPGYEPGKWNKSKDIDGNWHEFILQGKDNSCGPACVAIVKLAHHPNAKDQLREPEVRGIIAQFESGKQHQGISPLSSDINLHDWKNVGSNRQPLLDALKAKPFPVASARGVSNLSQEAMLIELGKCSPKKPAIIGWNWNGGGGHWTVCVGPSSDKSKLVILDPWHGIQYVKNDLTNFTKYQNGNGSLDFSDPTLTH